MDPKELNVSILRVGNGWIVRPNNWGRDYSETHEMRVASTPDKLVDLIHAWASKQQQDQPQS